MQQKRLTGLGFRISTMDKMCGVAERLCLVVFGVLPPVCGRIAEMFLVNMDIGE